MLYFWKNMYIFLDIVAKNYYYIEQGSKLLLNKYRRTEWKK